MKAVIFECEGGSDKWIYGQRKDTAPIVECLKKRGVHVEVIFYREEWKETIVNHIKDFDCYIPRINPGNLPNESAFFDTLRDLSKSGMIGMTHPDTMLALGSKSALAKLVGTGLVPDCTKVFYEEEDFMKAFPVSLSRGERVLKQNRGSTGEGIWRVSLNENLNIKPGEPVPLTAEIKCTEAKDNHVEIHKLGDFMNFCRSYIQGEGGMLVDMKFLPRIREGELRFLMVDNKQIFLIKKVPADAEDAFSATLFSGAKYSYHKPEEFPKLYSWFINSLESIKKCLISGDDLPLIWCADFILDTDEKGEDAYCLGEINCSCVGFTSNIGQGIEDLIADNIVARIEKKKSNKLK